MNREELFEAINGIRDEYIAEADPTVSASIPVMRRLRPVLAMVAVMALAIGLVSLAGNRLGTKNETAAPMAREAAMDTAAAETVETTEAGLGVMEEAAVEAEEAAAEQASPTMEPAEAEEVEESFEEAAAEESRRNEEAKAKRKAQMETMTKNANNMAKQAKQTVGGIAKQTKQAVSEELNRRKEEEKARKEALKNYNPAEEAARHQAENVSRQEAEENARRIVEERMRRNAEEKAMNADETGSDDA